MIAKAEKVERRQPGTESRRIAISGAGRRRKPQPGLGRAGQRRWTRHTIIKGKRGESKRQMGPAASATTEWLRKTRSEKRLSD